MAIKFILAALFMTHSWVVASNPLPTVDLGYEIHQAISFNSTGQYYNFTNIRYGRPPTGELRFTAPKVPLINRTEVQTGETGGTCPQAFAVWYLCGRALLSGTINSTAACNASLIPEPDRSEQEDCLFLDVIAPKSIFSLAGKSGSRGAPVMVWIYGGGFAFGKKYDDGNPAGIIKRSQEEDPTRRGVIYVTLNYRGGAFGFLSGSDVQTNGSSNVGLLDQRLALDWVQKYIRLFGGDPDNVTIFGQSAGAGSIIHQITAYGGARGPAPFKRAILQSPGFQPFPGRWEQEQLMRRYFDLLNVSTIDDARKLPFAALTDANIKMVASSPYGTFTWAPVVDGSFAPALPGSLLAQGSYDNSVQIMTGFNAHETLYFTDPNRTNNSVFASDIVASFPGVQSSVVNYISQQLYPPIFDGKYPYKSFFERSELSLAESAFTCNTYFLQNALRRYFPTYGYRFSIQPAYHGEDVPYTYYNGPSPRVLNDTIAVAMQRYLTRFALFSTPNAAGDPLIPEWGTKQFILDLNVTGMSPIKDPNANDRCAWWQKALYY